MILCSSTEREKEQQGETKKKSFKKVLTMTKAHDIISELRQARNIKLATQKHLDK